MEKKNLLFTVPVFRETNVYVLAGDREEARRIAEECVLSGAFLKVRTQFHCIDSDGVPITREEVDNLEKSGKRIYTGDSMAYSEVIRNILVSAGFDSQRLTIEKLLGTATYCVRFYDTMDFDLLDYALESFDSKPKTFVSTGFDKEKNRFTQVLMKFNNNDNN